MRTVNATKRCHNCGCLSFADASRCPKCNSICKKDIDLNEEVTNIYDYIYNSDVFKFKKAIEDISNTFAEVAISQQTVSNITTIVIKSNVDKFLIVTQ